VVSRRTAFFTGLMLALALTFAQGSARGVEGEVATDGEGREFVAGEMIVKLADGADESDLERVNERNDAETEETLPGDLALVDLPRDLTVEEAVETYEDSPSIEYAEPDYLLRPAATPNDPDFSSLYGLNNTGQTGGTPDADIDAPEAWDVTTGDPNLVVAVIDSGVDVNHPDLRENIWTNPGEIPDNGIDDDRNGYVDDVNGWDFFNNDNSVYDPVDVDDHGTHVAGTIAAKGDNALGVVGVNWQAKIMPLKFIGPNTGRTTDAVKALDYALNKGVKISNNSWGGSNHSQSLRDAIARADAAGHLFVAAAGNGGLDRIGDDTDAAPFYPASYDLPNIVSVAATNSRDELSSFSNFGATSVDLAAPGVSIRSTMPGGGYGTMSGTSMASPHVAGVAALLGSVRPGLSSSELKSSVLVSVDAKPNLAGKLASGGRLNAAGALASVDARPQNVEPPPDTVKPAIAPLNPRPGAAIRARTPAITAVVRDDRTDLARRHVRLFLDGRARNFQYDARTDRLYFKSPRLAYGRHSVRVVATDDAGNTAVRVWRFRVVR
jgi:thermitase